MPTFPAGEMSPLRIPVPDLTDQCLTISLLHKSKENIVYLFFSCSKLHFQLIHVNFCAAFCSEYHGNLGLRNVWIAVTIHDTWQAVYNRACHRFAAVQHSFPSAFFWLSSFFSSCCGFISSAKSTSMMTSQHVVMTVKRNQIYTYDIKNAKCLQYKLVHQ